MPEDGDQMSEQMKIIGNRRPATGFEQAASFLDTVIALRGDRPFIPKGYYRFKTFAEAQDWSIRMMARTGSTLSARLRRSAPPRRVER